MGVLSLGTLLEHIGQLFVVHLVFLHVFLFLHELHFAL
jgi:hypothetical protein